MSTFDMKRKKQLSLISKLLWLYADCACKTTCSACFGRLCFKDTNTHTSKRMTMIIIRLVVFIVHFYRSFEVELSRAIPVFCQQGAPVARCSLGLVRSLCWPPLPQFDHLSHCKDTFFFTCITAAQKVGQNIYCTLTLCPLFYSLCRRTTRLHKWRTLIHIFNKTELRTIKENIRVYWFV